MSAGRSSPRIGEIKSGHQLGYVDNNKRIWAACELRGKKRWVRVVNGEPTTTKCSPCARRGKTHVSCPIAHYLKQYIDWPRDVRCKWTKKERRTIEELQATADKKPTIENLTDLRIEVERIQSERTTEPGRGQ